MSVLVVFGLAVVPGFYLLPGISRLKIVILDGETANPGDNPWTPLEALGQVTVYPQTQPDELLSRAKDADILLTNKVIVSAASLNQLPALKFIAITATGVNVVDCRAAASRGVLVSQVPSYSTDSVAQHVFTGLLSLLHRPEMHYQAILQGEWERSGNFSFWQVPQVELAGKTMGIVGMGRIGRAVAKIADALGMHVVANSRSPAEPLKYAGFRWLDWETLLATADVISLHCPQTDANSGFVNQQSLSMMKPTAILVNTARGGLVNELDLASALNSGGIAGAFLDVVSVEPIARDNPLLGARNCLITPHLGWATIEARRRLLQVTYQNVAAFINGTPINLV